MSLLKKTERMDIYLEESRGIILIREKWKYNWLNDRRTTAWTYFQRRDFHKKVDDLIWKNWGSHFKVKTKGTSDFAKKFSSKPLILNFDIEWVIQNAHWNVNVTKIIPNSFMTSNVEWNNRVVNLDTEDTKLILKEELGHKKFFQYPAVHEFGHAIGNSLFSKKGMHGDEYKIDSGFKFDKSSVMNVGNQLRNRHIDYILSQLNSAIPNVSFYVV